MTTINLNWYAGNETRRYPIADEATNLDDTATPLPTDVLADLRLTFPSALARYAWLSSVTITDDLATVTILGTTSALIPAANEFPNLDEPALIPLGAVTILRPVPYRPYAIRPLQDGVAGWVVFGQGAKIPLVARFSSPEQAFLLPTAARQLDLDRVPSIQDANGSSGLSGIVRLSGQAPLEIVGATRTIEGVSRRVIAIRLQDKFPDALQTLAGPCAGRPEAQSCGDQTPIEMIGPVSPDCDGEITIEVRGCLSVYRTADGHGALLDCSSDMTDVCPASDLPVDGVLPNDYDDRCIVETPFIAQTAPPVPEPLPIEPTDVQTLIGRFEQTDDRWTAVGAMSINLLRIRQFDSSKGKRYSIGFTVTTRPAGSVCGLAINILPVAKTYGHQFFYFGYDHDQKALIGSFFDGSNSRLILFRPLPHETTLWTDQPYELQLEVLPGAAIHQALVNVRLRQHGLMIFETGTVMIGGMSPDNGVVGFAGTRLTNFSNYSVETL
jgi:hypothetical protein